MGSVGFRPIALPHPPANPGSPLTVLEASGKDKETTTWEMLMGYLRSGWRTACDGSPLILLLLLSRPVEGQELWTVGDSAMVSIGVAAGPPEYELYDVRGASLLDDGRIVVGNGGTREIRIYDPDGRHIVSFGRGGEGPGEFRSLNSVVPFRGDSIFVFDWRLKRISVFDTDGNLGSIASLRFLAEMGLDVNVLAPFPHGSVLGTIEPGIRTDTMTTGSRSNSIIYFRWDREGFKVDTLGTFPGGEYHVHAWGRGTVSQFPRPFGTRSYVAMNGDGFAVGNSSESRIDMTNGRGGIIRSIPVPGDRRRVGRSEIRDYERLLRDDWADSSDPARVERILEAMDYPDLLPVFSALIYDSEGNLWVQSYAYDPGEPAAWSVLDRSGRLKATIQLPAGFEVSQIGKDFVLGAWKDEMDVEQVRLYRLTRGR